MGQIEQVIEKFGVVGVGPRQVIEFMSQCWKRRADFGLRVAIWVVKSH